jgi:nucleosome binding factor SPN SPT16 subunit
MSFELLTKIVFLDSSVDIPMSEGPVNLNWGPIMKHVNENPYEFFQGGGWTFLGGVGGAESEDSEQSDSMSEFEAQSDDFAESSSEGESEYSEDVASDDSGSYGDDDSDDGEFLVGISIIILNWFHD